MIHSDGVKATTELPPGPWDDQLIRSEYNRTVAFRTITYLWQ